MAGKTDPKVLAALFRAVGDAEDAFFRSWESSERQYGFTLDQLRDAVRAHLPFGIEMDEALEEYIGEMSE